MMLNQYTTWIFYWNRLYVTLHVATTLARTVICLPLSQGSFHRKFSTQLGPEPTTTCSLSNFQWTIPSAIVAANFPQQHIFVFFFCVIFSLVSILNCLWWQFWWAPRGHLATIRNTRQSALLLTFLFDCFSVWFSVELNHHGWRQNNFVIFGKNML